MKIISLFCGCGGMDLGLLKAGHKIVYANDNDKDSIETYKKYFTKKFKISPSHIHLNDVKKEKIKDIPDGDVIVGGFPCQGFSIANIFRKDKRTMERKNNDLYLEMIRIIKGKKPKYFIAENVPGILSLGGYANKEAKRKKLGRIFTSVLSDFQKIGYKIKWQILNAAEFGVPQSRRRVIILGTRKDIKKDLVHPQPTHSIEDDLFLKKTPNLWDAIKDLEKIKLGDKKIFNHEGSKHKVKFNGYIGNRVTKKNKVSPTIVGRGGGTGGPVIIAHPNGKRRLTVRETARLQAFPDDMFFCGPVSSGYRQIGNAVAWPVAYALGKMLKIIS